MIARAAQNPIGTQGKSVNRFAVEFIKASLAWNRRAVTGGRPGSNRTAARTPERFAALSQRGEGKDTERTRAKTPRQLPGGLSS
jgi:hypothetical protein